MIPDFLKKYEKDLKKYQRDFIKINAKPTKDGVLNDSLNLKQSKFLGKPFFPKEKKYPKDINGKPMIMITQINFEELPELEYFPKDGIFQLYLSSTDWYEENFEVFYHSKEELGNDFLIDFSFLNEVDYEELPVFKIHKLSFQKSIDNGASEDSQFDFLFNDMDYWDFEETLNDKQKVELSEYFIPTGHKIGGYADFTQSDPREYEKQKRNDIQLLQIDTDNHIMFGDSGLGHVFINKEDLIKKEFSKAYFYWDCC